MEVKFIYLTTSDIQETLRVPPPRIEGLLRGLLRDNSHDLCLKIVFVSQRFTISPHQGKGENGANIFRRSC